MSNEIRPGGYQLSFDFDATPEKSACGDAKADIRLYNLATRSSVVRFTVIQGGASQAPRHKRDFEPSSDEITFALRSTAKALGW